MSTLRRFPLALCIFPLALACSSGDDDDGPTKRDAGPSTVRDGGPNVRDGGPTPRDGGPDRDAGEDRDGGPRDGGEIRDGGPPMIRIPQLGADVDVKIDDLGMLHVRCASDADCFAAQGYFHAAHRFPQMDIRRRFARGRLAEVFGPLALGNDRTLRHFIASRTGQGMADVLWANADAPTRAMIEAYTRGVNTWIDDLRNNRNGAAVPPEYTVYRASITDWEPLDSVACILALIESLTNQSGTEIAAGEIYSALPTAQALDLFGVAPGSPSTILPPPITFTTPTVDHAARLAATRDVQARLEHAQNALSQAKIVPTALTALDGRGSNNWVVAPSRTNNGRALLANDPHLGMTQPSVWYVVSLDSKSAGGNIHVAGASFAGLPGIILGQNEDVAWGATTTFFDMADVYIETLNAAGDAVIFNGNEVPIQNVDFTFGVLGGQPVTETFQYVPHHGPVVSIDPQMGIAITIRWTGADADTDLNFLYSMMTSTNITEANTALRNVTTVGQNFVVIDRTGSIGWFPYNKVPNRPWNSPLLPSWLPLPGDGSAEWQGTVPYDELPQVLDPIAGYVATANNDMTGHLADGDPTNDGQSAIQHYVAVGYRHERIVERIENAGNNHDLASMQDIQSDIHSLLAERTLDKILAAADAGSANLDANGTAVVSALRGWYYECPTGLTGPEPDSAPDPDVGVASEAAGCAAFHAVWPRIVAGAFRDEVDAVGVTRLPSDNAAIRLVRSPSLLAGGETYWDDVSTTATTETSTSVIVAALNSAGMWLTTALGPTVDDWRWGRVHTVTLKPDLLSSLSSAFNNGPFSNDGGLYTVDVANPGGRYSDNYEHGSGPSMRLACESDSTMMNCTMELPGGNSSFPSSPYYENLMLRWLQNDPFPLRFLTADIDAAVGEDFVVRPQ